MSFILVDLVILLITDTFPLLIAQDVVGVGYRAIRRRHCLRHVQQVIGEASIVARVHRVDGKEFFVITILKSHEYTTALVAVAYSRQLERWALHHLAKL